MSHRSLSRRALLAGLLPAALPPAALAPRRAAAETPASPGAPFPARPVTIVVPFPPGGSTDVMTRLLAERMAPLLGQPVVIENRPGAATVIGAEAVARAAPDGHTMLMSAGTTLTINPLLPERLPYRVEDFAPISLVTKLPFGVVVRPGLPATIPEFVALARARPGQLNYGTNGPSSFNNIAALVLMDGLGFRMQDVTYRGDSQQLNDLVAGTLDVMVVGGSSALPAHRNGQGRIIGWTGEARLPVTPDIPTFAETDPRLVAQTWFGLLAPARTPRPVVERLNGAVRVALREPALQERLLGEGQFVASGTPEEFATFLRVEADRWRPVVARLSSGGEARR
ncbi:tripartite tricarboxylate transporter substrate binding protein [Roseomonas sp. NAR14]|uniref:Tripartite tricarboxylate transporter substrate binding protein n=1 Tax=Roseomonas acroporae TaxID=2937791 RepID=A0A9X2BWV9_9PROT|nr:tripartite tricarboxylate transporter substrate binding protein [Roseomonas acroporae]MCK8785339.1 tripartite tricarboxylate transporter substrate binding protein [Roseomonas acroporae]